MNAFLQHPIRVSTRLLWLAGEVVLALLDFLINVMFRPKVPLVRSRPLWLQHACRRLLRILDVNIRTEGSIPLKGLLVCNHLSYLDIVVISAIAPATFIANTEVKRWPLFGLFARLSGTLFVRRNRRTDVARLNREVDQALDAGGLVVLFPEGASSDGRSVLPFRSSLLEPAVRQKHPVTAAYISYALAEGDAGHDVCYWGDMTLGPHLINLLSKPKVNASVSFSRLKAGNSSRKELAQYLHRHVLRLKEGAPHQVEA